MSIDEAKFFAWLDGELDPAAAAEVESAVAADPRLASLTEQHRAFGTRLRGTFDVVVAAPVPERLTETVGPRRGSVIDFGARRQPSARAPFAPLPQWAVMAATLAVGVLVGTILNGSEAAGPVEVRGAKMYAAAQLDRALETELASSGAAGEVRVGLTFRDQTGTICRSFTVELSSGLACRDRSSWHVRGLFAAPEGQNGSYRMASGTNPNLGALIDATIAGDPFDDAQEEEAQRAGWR